MPRKTEATVTIINSSNIFNPSENSVTIDTVTINNKVKQRRIFYSTRLFFALYNNFLHEFHYFVSTFTPFDTREWERIGGGGKLGVGEAYEEKDGERDWDKSFVTRRWWWWWRCCRWWWCRCRPVRPDLAQFRHFGNILQVFGKFLTVYFLFGKIVNLLWQICYTSGLIFIVANGPILKYNLTIWSHWWYIPTPI